MGTLFSLYKMCTVNAGKGRGGKEKNEDKETCQYHIIFLV